MTITNLKKSKYVKAKTPEARKKQKSAIINYYTKKRLEEKKQKKTGKSLLSRSHIY